MISLFEAVEKRISRRTYIPKLIPQAKKAELNRIIADINSRSGLNIRLMENGEDCFGLIKSYGMFSGVKSYFALIGNESDPDLRRKAGYFGEELTLEATKLGLGTCWVAGSYDKNSCGIDLGANESLVCVISVGECPEKTVKEKAIEKTIKIKRKSFAEITNISGEAPEWFIKGVEYARYAPSARNKQPIIFEFDGENAKAFSTANFGYNQIDLGIAEFHFELGSGKKITPFNALQCNDK